MQKNRRNMVLLVSIIFVGSSLFGLALAGSTLFSTPKFGLAVPSSSNNYIFGSPGSNFTGWLMPAHTLILTSYTTNHSLNGFVSATLNVFPYRLPQNGTLYLGLYVNGKLAASNSYGLGQSVAHPAAILRSLVNGSGDASASFTPSLEGYSVTLTLNNSLPSGTIIGVTAYVSNPIWVQVDTEVQGLSFVEATPIPLPTSFGAEQALAAYTLSIQVQSNAS